MISQLFLSFFLLFALSRVIFQVRSGKLTTGAFLFWSSLFVFALTGVLEPELTSHVAKVLGIGRGADVVIYASIALIFYLIFRLSIALEETRREITELVRNIALKNVFTPTKIQKNQRREKK
ncbi:MAG: DUF2304 family protein [Patescibacteria group bacterium]